MVKPLKADQEERLASESIACTEWDPLSMHGVPACGGLVLYCFGTTHGNEVSENKNKHNLEYKINLHILLCFLNWLAFS